VKRHLCKIKANTKLTFCFVNIHGAGASDVDVKVSELSLSYILKLWNCSFKVVMSVSILALFENNKWGKARLTLAINCISQ